MAGVIEKAVMTDANLTQLARFTKKYHGDLCEGAPNWPGHKRRVGDDGGAS
jgi:hypothetical protein